MGEFISKYNKPIGLIMLILIIYSIGNIVKVSRANARIRYLEEKKTKINKVSKEKFAIYIREDSEYEEYDGETFPTEGYVLNINESYCMDINGNKVEEVITYENREVTVTSNKTLYCYIYFDRLKAIEIEYKNREYTSCETVQCSLDELAGKLK